MIPSLAPASLYSGKIAVLGALLVCLVVAAFFILAMSAMILVLGLCLRELYLAVRAGSHLRR